MKTPKTLAGSIAVLLLALVILGLGVSPVSASAVSWPSGTSTAVHGHGNRAPFCLQQYPAVRDDRIVHHAASESGS